MSWGVRFGGHIKLGPLATGDNVVMAMLAAIGFIGFMNVTFRAVYKHSIWKWSSETLAHV